ncbi:MAG: glycoside hydrolase family 3 N-terminal domain-containing protein [Anaerolineae bacterium]
MARVFLLLTLLVPLPVLHAQESAHGPEAQVEALLAAMSAEERVGQLFLVAFVGNDARPGSEIAALIRQEHVGGVVLLAANSNFLNGPDTPRQVAELANGLQALTMGAGSQVPLFVAVDHEGDGYPYTRITGGTTPLPNAMAIGATWDLDNARDVGQITGLELAAMGVNLLLGPSVDVLQTPRPSGQGDIGTRTFGGDPWWVGQMGQAYIEGVHQGSGGRVATVAKHFPGHGGSDRLPDEEVATVDKSLEDLKRVELAPFMAITGGGEGDDEVTDALMSSHIRYRGVQGDVRQFTAPISFDSEGMGAILDLEEFATWRQTGLMVSDSLGVPAVRKYFDPTLNTFPHRRIAKEAFLAGNDLLLLSQFDLNNVWADQLQNIRDTLAFFRDEYEASPTFAARVDEAVTRILRLKLKLYPEVCGLGTEVTEGIANQALTLLYPDLNAMPPPPDRGEKLLIFTDARPVRECFTDQCPPFAPLSQTAVEETILRAYGPEGTEQIAPEEITSLPFGQLKKFLLGEQVEYDIGTLLSEADWILFAQQDLNPVKGPNSDTVKLFLNDSQSASYEARLVVLAFNAPYYLDTTEISKLSLYLGGYSKVEPFIEAAVRTLFGEHVPRGVSPVDVVGINYDLERQLGPDATQTIPLLQLEPADSTGLQPPVSVRLQAGPIWDRNGHRVRDGTLLTVYAEYAGGAYAPPVSAYTVNGLAEASVVLNNAGQVRLRAESGEARNSQGLDLTIQPLATATVTPTRTPLPTPTERPTPVSSPSPRPSPAPTPGGQRPSPAAGASGPVDGADLGLAAGATLLIAVGSLFLLQLKQRPPATAVRWVLLSIIGGMFGYILYALQVIHPERWEILPDVAWLAQAMMIGMVMIGAVLPLVVVMMMSRLRGHEL